MIEDVPFEDERILGFRISGKVDLMDLLPQLGRLNPLLERGLTLRAYVEIGDLDGVSLKALAKDLRYAFTHFRSLASQFERVAIVTDNTWVRGATKLESLSVPGMEERVFRETEVAEARAWIEERG